MTYEDDLKNACKRDRQFQDKMHKELSFVHEVLADDTLSRAEKIVSLVARGWGKQRAREIVDRS